MYVYHYFLLQIIMGKIISSTRVTPVTGVVHIKKRKPAAKKKAPRPEVAKKPAALKPYKLTPKDVREVQRWIAMLEECTKQMQNKQDLMTNLMGVDATTQQLSDLKEKFPQSFSN